MKNSIKLLLATAITTISLQADTVTFYTHAPIWGVESSIETQVQCTKTSIPKGARRSEPGAISKTISFLDETGLSTLVMMFGVNQLSSINAIAYTAHGMNVGRAVVNKVDKVESKETSKENCYSNTMTNDKQVIIGYDNCGTFQGEKVCKKSVKPIFYMEMASN